jgi:type II secretory pathway pseudopilin PulG
LTAIYAARASSFYRGRSQSDASGFTLIELATVIIIAILTAMITGVTVN